MDKNKIIENASKLVAKGSYDKAIKEYQKVLEADPRDVRILQKMGDLYQKKNDIPEAAKYFVRVAESYATDGFFLKAVAFYKQVLKLNPNLMEVNLKLAELHQQLQLMSEAMNYYQIVANHYDKAGDVKASLETLKKMVDLDPDNLASREKLAELFARERMVAQAMPEFKRAADYYKRNGRTDDYLRVAEKIMALDAADLELARELAEMYLLKGDQKRALAKLQLRFKANPRDFNTLQLLAQAFEGLGQVSKTVSVYKELIKVHEEGGRTIEADQIWAKIRTLDPTDPDIPRPASSRPTPAPFPAPAAVLASGPPPGAAKPAAPTPAPPAAPPASARPVAAAPPPPEPKAAPAPTPAAPPSRSAPAAASASSSGSIKTGNGPQDGLTKLLTETDVYVKYGLHEKALDHLSKIFAVEPENIDAHEKAYQIYVASGDAEQSFEQLLNVLRLCTRRADSARAQPYLAKIMEEQPDHPELPTFLSVLGASSASAAAPKAAPASAPAPTPMAPETSGSDDGELLDDGILMTSTDEEVFVPPAPPDALAPSAEDLALYSGDDMPTGRDEEEIVEDAKLGGFTPMNEDGQLVEDPSLISYEEDEQVIDEPALSGDLGDEPGLEAALGALPEEEPELVPEPEQEEEAAPEAELEPESEPEPAHVALSIVPPPPPEPEQLADDPVADECDEAEFFIDQGEPEEAQEILETILLAYPDHPRATRILQSLEARAAPPPPKAVPAKAAPPPKVATPPKAAAPKAAPPKAAPPKAEEKDAFDLAAELAGELSDYAAEEPGPEPLAGDDFQYSVEEVFSEFKKGLEKVVKPGDVDTHYDLGIAYKEMDLIDDALSEFNIARQGCIGQRKEIDCLSMSGLLLVKKGEPGKAIEIFQEVLRLPQITPDVAMGIEYELGVASEANDAPGKALWWFQRVNKVDPKFRDVAAMVARLSKVTQPEEPPPPAAAAAVSKSRKVGYV